MLKLLRPKLYLDSLFDIRADMLTDLGIKALILDLDNTLVVRGEERVEPQVTEWLQELKERGFKLCIVSNNSRGKGGKLARALGLPGVFRAVKPRGKPFRKALGILGEKPSSTAMVGDQLFTDVLGGNRMGLYTIMISSLGGPDFILTRLVIRKVEKIVLSWLGYKRNLVRGTGG
ncbi:MAG: YqeG family HAD IIIA-type phosphatase [Bacillota bacterium]